MNKRILFVDDEDLVLQGASRLLGESFDVDTVNSSEKGLVAIRERGPYAAVVSDMHMPAIGGVAFLQQVAECSPLSTRILLTGRFEFEAIIRAVNQGHIFKILCKPCPATVMIAALTDAVRQHELSRAQSLQQEQSIEYMVHTLREVLAIVRPGVAERATRVAKLGVTLAESVGAKRVAEIERAALLSELGFVGVPERVLTAAAMGTECLSAADKTCFDQHASIARRILAKHPHLQSLSRMMSLHHEDENAGVTDASQDNELLLAKAILKTASDYDLFARQGMLPQAAFDCMSKQKEAYEERIIYALGQALHCEGSLGTLSLKVADICIGMKLEQEVVTKDGRPLIRFGTELTEHLLDRLRAFAANGGIAEPILVIPPQRKTPQRDPAEEHSAEYQTAMTA